MPRLINAEIRCAIEIREDDARESPGRLVGTLVTYGERAGDRPERFAPGALSWPDGGIVLREQHNRQAPIARMLPEVQGNAVVLDSPLPDTQRGRDAGTLIRNGTFRGLSVEFRARSERQVDGMREVLKADLIGAGLVDDPSYGGSRVKVRGREGGRRRRLWL